MWITDELSNFIVYLRNPNRVIQRHIRNAKRKMDEAQATMDRHSEGTPWHTRARRKFELQQEILLHWEEVRRIRHILLEQGIDPRDISPRDQAWRSRIEAMLRITPE